MVNSIAIITAYNPFGARLSHKINFDLNRKLRIELQENAHPLMQMEGHYAGNQEHSYLVVNISRQKLEELANKYKQKAAIWAFRRDDDNETYLQFQYLENGKVVGNKVVLICKSWLEEAEDLFHAIRTGSFKLPVLEKEEPEKTDTTEFSLEYD